MKSTESPSGYDNLHAMPLSEILQNINKEDQSVPLAVEKAIPQIENLINHLVPLIQKGGRLFYVGSGTSGRLGLVDASECPPTFGVSPTMVNGILAGGMEAFQNAVEGSEDSITQGWEDLQKHTVTPNDFVLGITASGTTPYVVETIKKCVEMNILTGCITCNENTQLAFISDFPVEVLTGPEFLTGSTRMKAGTAQKLVLNMISTSLMIKLGKVMGNKMVDMQLKNRKLINRGIRMLMSELSIDEEMAVSLLQTHNSVRKALDFYRKNA